MFARSWAKAAGETALDAEACVRLMLEDGEWSIWGAV
jgi:hypothetical protein